MMTAAARRHVLHARPLVAAHREQARRVALIDDERGQCRRRRTREGELRLIEIAGFDLTPCGGTHAYRTGEVGIIVVRSWERAKGMTRIEFLAGGRALADYRLANSTARSVASLFSAGRDDAPALAARMIDENKDLHRRLRVLEELAARVEAEELLREFDSDGAGVKDSAERDTAGSDRGSDRAAVKDSSRGLSAQRDTPGSDRNNPSDPEGVKQSGSTTKSDRAPRIITRVFDNREPESLKHIAQALITHANVIALLGSCDNGTTRLVFARSPDARGDMNALMRQACTTLDGRGGGKPDLAQGGGKNPERLPSVIAAAAEQCREPSG